MPTSFYVFWNKAIDILTIDTIVESNDKDFVIKYLDREFQLRATVWTTHCIRITLFFKQDSESKKEWISKLNILKQYHLELSTDKSK